MKHFFYHIPLLLLAAFGLTACSSDDDSAAPQWQLDEQMSDDFDNWNPDKWGSDIWVTSKIYAFGQDNVGVEDGCLKLKVTNGGSNGKSFTAGRVKSKFEIGGNTAVEIRARLPKHDAHVSSAIWMSDAPVAWKNPNAEIDIMESMPDDNWPDWKYSSGMIYWWMKATGVAIPSWVSFPKNQNWMQQTLGLTYARTEAGLSEDFHIYRLERSNGHVRFYFDGVLYWDKDWKRSVPTPANFEWAADMARPLLLSIESHTTPVADQLPAELDIDYVHVYRLVNP